MLKELNLRAFQNSEWILRLEEKDPLDALSYAGRINLSYRETERVEKPIIILRYILH
jgi:hypothetical protein